MKGSIFLVLTLATAFSQNTDGTEIVEIGEDKDITEANKDLSTDDILEPPATQRSSTNDDSNLWTSPVPYVLDKGLEMNAKGIVLRAFDQFRLKTCIDFKPRDSEEYYISVEKRGGCYSYVGKVIKDGQTLSIGRFCDTIAIAEHEFLHALGFNHEQSRYDRDDHVTIVKENIQQGRENNFRKVSQNFSTTGGLPYDYMSVMHYGKYAFTNGNGTTIVTKDPKFQDVIGQRLEMSRLDVREVNLRYSCNSSVAFKMYCGFSNQKMCQMSRCSRSDLDWEMVKRVESGPSSGHTDDIKGQDYFMHASTASGQKGDSAWLETRRMRPTRACHTQCLQFYYYNSKNGSDQLNIWIREFKSEQDLTGELRLMEKITGPATSHWQLRHVSLNAHKHFQVVFEVQKGAGMSSGGFSIDDINLSEMECPHVTMQIEDFQNVLENSSSGTTTFSPRHYSRGGYAYRVGVTFNRPYVGMLFQLLNGKNDGNLKWPCPERQVTLQMLDQTPEITLQMSKQSSITSNPTLANSQGKLVWGNPRENGKSFTDENGAKGFANTPVGRSYFSQMEEIQTKDFIKGGSAIFLFNFQDLTPLVTGSALPCPEDKPLKTTNGQQVKNIGIGPCSSKIVTTTRPPPTTTDDSIFGFSPAMASSPLLVLLPALMLLTR